MLIDLIGYRRFGHNESDEPAYTQPEMYAKIKSKKRVAELWADRLVAEGVVSPEEVERQAQEVWDNLTLLHQRLKAKIAAAAEHGGEHTTGEYQLDRSPSPEVETAVPAARLRSLGEAAAQGARTTSRCTRSSSNSSIAVARRWPTRPPAPPGSTGPTPRRSRSPRC